MTITSLRRKVPAIALAGWVALIFIFSSQPYQKQTIVPALHHAISLHRAEEVLPNINFVYDDTDYSSRTNPYAVMEFIFRKSAHLFMYGMLAVWTALMLIHWKKHILTVTLPMLLVIMVASLDEWNQSRIPGRTPNPQDVLVDTVGACIGLTLFFAIRYAYARYKSPPRLIK